ncbi:MAG TPA: hypothetical protein VLK34_06220, partial [Nocardioidaceae bacterium]|nr:hypothetical protein [Nocardioidaceae bacterium]
MKTHSKRARFTATRVAVAAAGLCLVSASMAATPTNAATSASPMAFGIFPGSATSKALQSIETSMGRSAAYVRVYRSWDDTFPDSNITAIRASGHTLFLSIKARLASGQNVSWQQIADAQPGSSLYANMVRWATAIKAYGMPMFVSFNHEPDTSNSQPSGTAAQFVLAWQKWVTVMRAQGVTNARFAWTVAVRNFSVAPSNKKYAPKYYPGDAWVDDISVDAYNMYCLQKNGQPS